MQVGTMGYDIRDAVALRKILRGPKESERNTRRIVHQIRCHIQDHHRGLILFIGLWIKDIAISKLLPKSKNFKARLKMLQWISGY